VREHQSLCVEEQINQVVVLVSRYSDAVELEQTTVVLSCKNKRAVKQQEARHRSALRVAPCRHPPARPGYRPVRCALAASSGDFLCTHLAGLGWRSGTLSGEAGPATTHLWLPTESAPPHLAPAPK